MKLPAWTRPFMLAHAVLFVGMGMLVWLLVPIQPWFAEATGATGYEGYALTRFLGVILIAYGLLLAGISSLRLASVPPASIGALLFSSLLGLGVTLNDLVWMGNSWQAWLLAAVFAGSSGGYAAALLYSRLGGRLIPDPDQLRSWVVSPALGMALQLGVGFILAAGMALGVLNTLLGQVSAEWAAAASLASGALVASTWFYILVRRIDEFDHALARLTRQQALEKPLSEAWPLGRIGASINLLHQEASNSQQMRATLAYQVSQAAAQQERNRLARELHDSIKQQLFSINASAAAVQARWEADPASALGFLEDVRQSAREAMTEMNALLQQLRPAPLENVGLLEALREQCEALSYRSGATVTHTFTEMPPADTFPIGAQEALFRISQEAFSNIARHARASKVEFSLAWEGDKQQVVLVVADDGKGFAPGQEPKGMGIANMKERARILGGNLTLESAPGEGTRLLAQLPVIQPPAPASTPEISPAELTSFNRALYTAALTFLMGTVVLGLAGMQLLGLSLETSWRLWAFILAGLGVSGYTGWQAARRFSLWRRQAGNEHPVVLQTWRQIMVLVYYLGAAVFWSLHLTDIPNAILWWAYGALRVIGLMAAAYAFMTQHRLTERYHHQLDQAGRAVDIHELWQRQQPILLLGFLFLMLLILAVSFTPLSLGLLLTGCFYLGYLLWLRRQARQKV